MTEAHFYLIQDSSYENFACRLSNKIYSEKRKLYIHTNDQTQAQTFDDLLWTFRDISFIPHSQHSQSNDAPIVIGYTKEQPEQNDVLLNLAAEAPSFFKNFQRIIEIVPSEANSKQLARQRYKFYRDHDCPIETHKVS